MIADHPSSDASGASALQRVSQMRVFMDTGVEIEVWAADAVPARHAIERAFNWFHVVEQTCSRFDPTSELSRLSRTVGRPVQVSPMLLHALGFALLVAEMSGGAFDPTIGDAMVLQGFDRDFRTGRIVTGHARPDAGNYRDVLVDAALGEVLLTAPVMLDLGAVAKGLAVDLASAELRDFPIHVVSAGGDMFARGAPPGATAWDIGVRDPRQPNRLLRHVRLRDRGICTSGSYFRHGPDDAKHHLLDGRTRSPTFGFASVTVVASSAMAADALATAAFALGPSRASQFLTRAEVDAIFITDAGHIAETPGMAQFR